MKVSYYMYKNLDKGIQTSKSIMCLPDYMYISTFSFLHVEYNFKIIYCTIKDVERILYYFVQIVSSLSLQFVFKKNSYA